MSLFVLAFCLSFLDVGETLLPLSFDAFSWFGLIMWICWLTRRQHCCRSETMKVSKLLGVLFFNLRRFHSENIPKGGPEKIPHT